MANDLHLSGPTVTLFGDHDVLTEALSRELGRRGCNTHAVSIPVGWLSTASHAVVRLDTPTGAQAMRDLADTPAAPTTHVVAVCKATTDFATSEGLRELCRQCGAHHDVSLIWHSAYESEADVYPSDAITAQELAATIADEVGLQEAWTMTPSFSTRTFRTRV